MKRFNPLSVVLLSILSISSLGACASSNEPSAIEHTGHVSSATIDDGRADELFGQPDFSTGSDPAVVSMLTARRPAGLSVGTIGSTMMVTVADRGNHRVRSVFANDLTASSATFHLGQNDWDEGEPNFGFGPSFGSLSGPVAVAQSSVGSTTYAVADTDNHRVVGGFFFSSPSFVLGQQLGFSSGNRNDGGLSSASLAEPKGVAYSYGNFGTRLWIADSGNHRLVGYFNPPGGFAAFVIGQHDDSTGEAIFTKGDPNDGKPLPSDRTLRDPRGLSANFPDFTSFPSVDVGLWVADTGNHRVLHFSECNSFESTGPCPNADFVIGQKDFHTADPSAGGVSAFSLNTPTAVARDKYGGVWIADTGHHRVLHFKRGSAKADRVLGQPDFVTSVSPTAVSATTLTAPTGVAVDANNVVYVADTGANRILRYAFVPSVENCDDGDPCTDDSLDPKGGGCVNLRSSFSKACFPYTCDLSLHACAKPCRFASGSGSGCQAGYSCTITGRCVQPCFSPDAECDDGGQCVDGWCCDSACKGTCESCGVGGNEGICSTVSGPPLNLGSVTTRRTCARLGLDDPECAGQCDGVHRTACAPSDVATSCGPETCKDGVATLRGACDGHGRCTFVTQSCAPYACAPNGCRNDCSAPHHCAADAECIDGACVPPSEQKVGGVGCSVPSSSSSPSSRVANQDVVSWSIAGFALGAMGIARRRRARTRRP